MARRGRSILAAHIGEPIRNLGIGVTGSTRPTAVCLREEKTQPAAYVILNIWRR